MEYPFDIHKVKQGDRTAFRDFFACMYPKLMALACRFVDENTATDMVQDVFASYWERKHLIEAHNIQSFLFKWLQNNCLNYLKHQTVVEAYETRVQLAEARAAAWDHASQANDPLHLLMGKNLLELVDEWIGKLPAKCAEAFRLCYFKDMTHKEIAEALHVSPRTVEGYIRNAIAFLRGKLGGG